MGTDGTQGTGGITPAEALGHLVGVRAVVLQQHRVARVDERSEERFAQRAQRDPPAAQPHRQAGTQSKQARTLPDKKQKDRRRRCVLHAADVRQEREPQCGRNGE